MKLNTDEVLVPASSSLHLLRGRTAFVGTLLRTLSCGQSRPPRVLERVPVKRDDAGLPIGLATSTASCHASLRRVESRSELFGDVWAEDLTQLSMTALFARFDVPQLPLAAIKIQYALTMSAVCRRGLSYGAAYNGRRAFPHSGILVARSGHYSSSTTSPLSYPMTLCRHLDRR